MVNESISLDSDWYRGNKLTHIGSGTEMMNEFLLYNRTGQSIILIIFLGVMCENVQNKCSINLIVWKTFYF